MDKNLASREVSDSDILRRTHELVRFPEREINNYKLTLIAPVRESDFPNCDWYGDYMSEELGNIGFPVQLLLVDNTVDKNTEKKINEDVFSKLPSNVSPMLMHQPKPGKIHCLNIALREAAAPYIMMFDINKRPDKGAMKALFERINNDDSLDLVSAVLRVNESQPVQAWNAGALHIGRQWVWEYEMPEVLGDDIYTGILTEAVNGKVEVAGDIIVTDYKALQLSPEELAMRLARWSAIIVQLQHLTIRHKEKLFHEFKINGQWFNDFNSYLNALGLSEDTETYVRELWLNETFRFIDKLKMNPDMHVW